MALALCATAYHDIAIAGDMSQLAIHIASRFAQRLHGTGQL